MKIKHIIIIDYTPQTLECIYSNHREKHFYEKELLSFYVSFMTFLGTMALSILALWQNKKANDINKNLQIKQLKMRINERNHAELLYFIKNIQTALDLINTDVFFKTFDSPATKNIELLVSLLNDSRTNAIKSSIKLEFIKNFCIYNIDCSKCANLCEYKEKTKEFKNSLKKFSKCYYQYINKYIDCINRSVDILYKRNQYLALKKEQENLIKENLILNDKLNVYPAHIFNLEIMTELTGNTNFQKILEKILDKEEAMKKIYLHTINKNLQMIENCNVNKYDDKAMETDLKRIKKTIKLIQHKGFDVLKVRALNFKKQCEIDLERANKYLMSEYM